MIDEDEVRGVYAVIERRGLRHQDFDFMAEDDDVPVDETAVPNAASGVVVVVYRPTGREKTYRTGGDAVWAADCEADIEAGYFA